MAGAGKAFGALGGYVAASEVVATAIKSQSRSFIFTTAMPPVILAAILEALDIIRGADALRAQLRKNMAALRKLLAEQGFDYLDSRSHIFPVMTGGNECTRRACEALLEQGIFAQGAIYPSVPPNQGRLRVTVLPQHTEEDLHRLMRALVAVRASVKGFGVLQEA